MITRTIKYTASDGTEHDSPQAAARYTLEVAIKEIADEAGLVDYDPVSDLVKVLAYNPEALRDAVNAYFEDMEAHPDVEDFGCDPAYFDDYYQTDSAFSRKMREEGILAEAHPDVEMTGTIGQPLDPDRMSVKVNDHRICAICDGGPGNNCACTCGMKKWDDPDPNPGREPPHPSGLVLTDSARKLTPDKNVGHWLAQGWTPEELMIFGHAVPAKPEYVNAGDVTRGVETQVAKGLSQNQPWNFRPTPMGDPNDPTTWRADLPVDHPNYCRPFGTKEK